jgi:hypothetical protein
MTETPDNEKKGDSNRKQFYILSTYHTHKSKYCLMPPRKISAGHAKITGHKHIAPKFIILINNKFTKITIHKFSMVS